MPKKTKPKMKAEQRLITFARLRGCCDKRLSSWSSSEYRDINICAPLKRKFGSYNNANRCNAKNCLTWKRLSDGVGGTTSAKAKKLDADNIFRRHIEIPEDEKPSITEATSAKPKSQNLPTEEKSDGKESIKKPRKRVRRTRGKVAKKKVVKKKSVKKRKKRKVSSVQQQWEEAKAVVTFVESENRRRRRDRDDWQL